MINAAHLLMYSRDAEADRVFFRDVLGWPFVQDGPPEDNWLIFQLPPGEVGVHPTQGVPSTALYLMCEDLRATLTDLGDRGVRTTGEPHDEAWGLVTAIVLPSGAELGLYQPKHATAYQRSGR